MSFVNLATRVAILPVLALTLPNPPALALLIVGSFALLYGQLILPTPAGAGAVELGFLGGPPATWRRRGLAAAGLALLHQRHRRGLGSGSPPALRLARAQEGVGRTFGGRAAE